MSQVDPLAIELNETVSIGIVLGTSVFGMVWGLINALLVRYLPRYEFLTITLG